MSHETIASSQSQVTHLPEDGGAMFHDRVTEDLLVAGAVGILILGLFCVAGGRVLDLHIGPLALSIL